MNILKPQQVQEILTLLRGGLSAREICRRFGYDRATVKKYAESHGLGWKKGAKPATIATTGSARNPVENPPPPATGLILSSRSPLPPGTPSTCEPHRGWMIEQLRLGRNAVAIYQDMVELFAYGHTYSSVKRFVAKIREKEPERFDHLEFLPGEEAQVDYGQGAPTLYPKTSKYRKPRLFVMTLKYSRKSFRKVIWNSSKEAWSRLHEDAFRHFGGVPQYVVLDNLKEGVIKPDLYEPELNPLYAEMLAHYGAVADPARVRDPNRKGTVESAIQHTQGTALKGRRFESIEAQNAWLAHWEEAWASKRIHGRAKRQVAEMFIEEKPHLRPLPLMGFRYFAEETRTVHDDGCIQVGHSYYGAHPLKIGKTALVRIYDIEIEIIDPTTMTVIRRHMKSERRGKYQTGPEDEVFNPTRHTEWFLKQAHQLGPRTEALCERLMNQRGRTANRAIRALLSLTKRYKARELEAACELALERGVTSVKAIRGWLEASTIEVKTQVSALAFEQQHALIRPSEEYDAFWNAMTGKQKGETDANDES